MRYALVFSVHIYFPNMDLSYVFHFLLIKCKFSNVHMVFIQ